MEVRKPTVSWGSPHRLPWFSLLRLFEWMSYHNSMSTDHGRQNTPKFSSVLLDIPPNAKVDYKQKTGSQMTLLLRDHDMAPSSKTSWRSHYPPSQNQTKVIRLSCPAVSPNHIDAMENLARPMIPVTTLRLPVQKRA